MTGFSSIETSTYPKSFVGHSWSAHEEQLKVMGWTVKNREIAQIALHLNE